MHTRKKDTLLAFVLLCALTLALALATAWRPNVVFAVLLVVCLAGSVFGGYRVLCFSDDWYRVQEVKEQRWYAKHPRLTAFLVVLGVVNVLWGLFDFIRRLL